MVHLITPLDESIAEIQKKLLGTKPVATRLREAQEALELARGKLIANQDHYERAKLHLERAHERYEAAANDLALIKQELAVDSAGSPDSALRQHSARQTEMLARILSQAARSDGIIRLDTNDMQTLAECVSEPQPTHGTYDMAAGDATEDAINELKAAGLSSEEPAMETPQEAAASSAEQQATGVPQTYGPALSVKRQPMTPFYRVAAPAKAPDGAQD